MADTVVKKPGLRHGAAAGMLATLYATAAWLARHRRRENAVPRARGILVIGTFHNPNWSLSHLAPLANCGLGEVCVVCDEPAPPLVNVRFACPPRWLQRLLTRAGAKLCWSLLVALRRRPDLYMGYHIFPCGLLALVLGRLFDRPACYQMTAGPLEIEGGGWQAENRLLRALGEPSALVERRAAAVVREFDSVVVRGSGAAAFVRGLGYGRNLAIITGSVMPAEVEWGDFDTRPIDIAFVGRMAECKRLDRFVTVIAAIVAERPATCAAVIGDGPCLATAREQVRLLGLEENVTFFGQRNDVDTLLAMTKVFLLTSQSEGLSIAMLEAMAAGTVPIVADVGDLRDGLEPGHSGYLVAADDVAAYARTAIGLLTDADAWRACSRRAARHAAANSGRDAIAARWRTHLNHVLAAPPPEAHAASASGSIR